MPRRKLVLAVMTCAAVLPVAFAVELEDLRPISPVARYERTVTGILLHCADSSEVAVDVLSASLIRVRAANKSPVGTPQHSWAIAKTDWVTPAFNISDTTRTISLTTTSVEVSIHRDPLLISFNDPRSHTAWNSDFQPMLFGTKSPAIGVQKKLGFDEHFYGLGEKAAPLDKRRGRFTMWNTDSYRYTWGTDPIYQSIPFYIGMENSSAYGLFYDNSYRSSFDLGSRSEEAITYTADGGPLTYYFLAGPSIKSILTSYTELTGRMPLPPRWALGHQQSRYSYYPDSEVLKVAETYRAHDIPLEAINLDINYMNGYRDFTFDPKRFPDAKELTRTLAQNGVKLVTIVDPGVKYDPNGYRPYSEGVQKDYFLKRSNGKLYIGKVWPGDAVFVDYTKPDAAHWWGTLLRAYTDVGVAGIWTDMNEPSDFVDQTGATQMDVVSYEGGRSTTYAQNRNLFALQMAKATYEGLLSIRPNERPYVITRAGYAGIQRYSTMWTGDNVATWDSLALSIPMFESLGLSGEAFVGADVGGFAGNTNAQLLTRWYEVGFLTPFFRNHAEMGTYDHEPWRFGPYYEEIIRKYIKLRYRLLPFLYTVLEEAHRTGIPVIRPLVLNYQDDRNVPNVEDEFMVGEDLLAAPITKPELESRSVYLPAGVWYNFWTNESMEGGRWLTVHAPLDTVPLFVRGGAILPMGPEVRWSDEKPLDPLTFIVYPGAKGEASGTIYEDDGKSPAYVQGVYRRTKLAAGRTQIVMNKPEGTLTIPVRRVVFTVAGKTSVTGSDTGTAQTFALP